MGLSSFFRKDSSPEIAPAAASAAGGSESITADALVGDTRVGDARLHDVVSTQDASEADERRLAWWQMTLIGVAALVVVCGGVAYGSYVSWANSGTIAPGIIVQGENVGGLTDVEARKRLEKRFGRLFIEVKAPEKTYKLGLKQLGGEPSINDAVKSAYWFGRSGNVVQNVWNVHTVRREPKRLPLPVKWDKAQLRKRMWTVAAQFNSEPKNATLFVDANGVQVIPETPGRALNVGETLKQLQKKYYAGLPAVEATVRNTPARVTAASLAGSDVLLGEYVTRFNSGLWGRTRNIEVASATVDGKVLMPGQEFSFNKATGERTWDKGYRMAHIFETKPGKSQAEVVDGLAGGVCQVSSTLYNAIRKSNEKAGDGFTIVERNHHSLPVDYVPYGRDATVAWPIKDFRFKNSLPHPVYLRSTVEGNRLRIGVWARVPDGQAASVAATTSESDPQNS